MADLVDFAGIGTIKATFLTSGSIVYDPTEERGHALAGFGALRITGPSQMGLAVLDSRVHAIMDSVEPDGKVVAIISGIATAKNGDGPLPVSGVSVIGDTLGGADGYVKAGAATDWDTLVIDNTAFNGDIILRL